MEATKIEEAVRAAFSDEALKSRIVNEGPVVLADVLEELEAREAAKSLGGRIAQLDDELTVQQASDGWI